MNLISNKIFYLVVGIHLLVFPVFGEKQKGSTSTINQSDKLNLFDGSSLMGRLESIDSSGNLKWLHSSSPKAIQFDYTGIKSIVFNRFEENNQTSGKSNLKLHFRNGDFLHGTLLKKDEVNLYIGTNFQDSITLPLTSLETIEFLPQSYEILYDSSAGLENWKSSNSKSWSHSDGDLVSVFSGSTGTVLPTKETIRVDFQAQWERSFYLAIRFFSDSDGGSYGNIGYNLSFSNNRLGLQVNQNKNGRTVRESIGSKVVQSLNGLKSGLFSIYANRKKKEFVVFINGKEVARWKNLNNVPIKNDGILFINQGGNSFLRLKSLSISGWDGGYFPHPQGEEEEDISNLIHFTNGDYTKIHASSATSDSMTIETKHGTFDIPLESIKSLKFSEEIKDDNHTGKHSTNGMNNLFQNEEITLYQAYGKLSLTINSISEGKMLGTHPDFGEFSMPLSKIKILYANRNTEMLGRKIAKLTEIKKSIKNGNIKLAYKLLGEIDEKLRGWCWDRFKLFVSNSQSKEILNFNRSFVASFAKAIFAQDGNRLFSRKIPSDSQSVSQFIQLSGLSKKQGYGFIREVEELPRKIRITHPYWIGNTEITQKLYAEVMQKEISFGEGMETLPAVANWHEAQAFCERMNKLIPVSGNYEWRLPTEAEWEFACKGNSIGQLEKIIQESDGNETAFHRAFEKIASYDRNAKKSPSLTGSKDPTPSGLLDMHGNFWEWCMDSVSENKVSLKGDRRTNISNPLRKEGNWRSLRGGSHKTSWQKCRSTYRGASPPDIDTNDVGFRIVLGRKLNLEENASFSFPQKVKGIDELGLNLVKIQEGEFVMGLHDHSTPLPVWDGTKEKWFWSDSKGIIQEADFDFNQTQRLCELDSSELTSQIKLVPSKNLLVGDQAGIFKIIDLEQRKVIFSNQVCDSPITSITANHNNSMFAVGSLSGSLKIFKTENKSYKEFRSVKSDHIPIDSLSFFNDSDELVVFGQGAPVYLYNMDKNSWRTLLKNENGQWAMVRWHPIAKSIVALSTNGMLGFFEPTSKLNFQTIDLNLPKAEDFLISPTGKSILISNGTKNCSIRNLPELFSILVFDAKGIPQKSPDYYFSFSKPENRKQKLFEFLKEHNTDSKKLVYSPDGNWILSDQDGSLRLWSAHDQSHFLTLAEKLSAPFIDCAFSKDGKIIAGKLQSGEILLYPGFDFFNNEETYRYEDIQSWFDR